MYNIDNSDSTLKTLVDQVTERNNRSADFLAATNNLQKVTDSDGNAQIVIEASGGEPTRHLDINNHTAGQIAAAAEIDTRTARRLQENYPVQYDALINARWQKEPVNRMVRTYLDAEENRGQARAFVSDKFKTFDNVNLLNASLPQLMESDAQWKVVNANVTDKKLYLRLKSEVQTGLPAVGDKMANGIGLSNSEVGAGSVSVFQTIWTLACLNGMQTENRNRSSHITSARDSDDYGLLSSEAKDADNHALELKLRDLTGAYASRDMFDKVLDQMSAAHSDIIEGEFSEIPERIGTVMRLTKKENTDILNGLMATMGQDGYAGKPVSRATVVNALTNVANKCEPDDVDLWQTRGGKLLNMNERDWQRIAA